MTRDGRPFARDRLPPLFAGLGERAGVPQLHPYRLRRTFATEFLRNQGNPHALQRLLRHTSLDMVRRYAAIAETDLRAALDLVSPVDHWRL